MPRRRTTHKPSDPADELQALVLRAVIDLTARGWTAEEVWTVLGRSKRTYDRWLAQIRAVRSEKEREGYRCRS